MKILNIAGARPNFIKIAPLMRAMSQRPAIDASIIHTGQHYDDTMSRIFFEALAIPQPVMNLEVGSGTRDEQIERIMARFDSVVVEQRPDIVLVVGDVNSTIACARVAKHHGVAVAHVEAGLRSFDETMPEEINRVETDKISDLLFVTEPSGMENLQAERVPGSAHLVGNVMIDSLVEHLPKARERKMAQSLGLEVGSYWLGTFHRPSNVDRASSLENVVVIIEHATRYGPFVLPLHPRTRKALVRFGLLERLETNKDVLLVDPLGYLEFISLMSEARGLVTDSGGVQEESTYLRIPCVTMRDNTERPITVEVGSNVLAGTDPGAVISAIDAVGHGTARKGRIPKLWDGKAAPRIVSILDR